MILSLEERLNQILPRITSRDFLDSKGLGNEIGFWVFDYPPERELDVRNFVAGTVLPALAKVRDGTSRHLAPGEAPFQRP